MKIKGDFRAYPEWVYHELQNWARWCWLGQYPHPMPPTTCSSFEKNYRYIGEGEEKREEKPIAPNVERAGKVQAVWDMLPIVPQQVLRAEYPQRHESGRVAFGRVAAARWLRSRDIAVGNLDGYESALSVAMYKVMVAFEGGI